MLGLVPPAVSDYGSSVFAGALADAGLSTGRLCWFLCRRLQAAQRRLLLQSDVPDRLQHVFSDYQQCFRLSSLLFKDAADDGKYADDIVSAVLDNLCSDRGAVASVALAPMPVPRPDDAPDDDDELGVGLPAALETYRAAPAAFEPQRRSRRRGWYKDVP